MAPGGAHSNSRRLVSDCDAITALHSAQSDYANSRTVPSPKSTAILARRSGGSPNEKGGWCLGRNPSSRRTRIANGQSEMIGA